MRTLDRLRLMSATMVGGEGQPIRYRAVCTRGRRATLQSATAATFGGLFRRGLARARSMLSAVSMNPILKLLRLGRASDEPPPRALKALDALSVASLPEARRRADQILTNAKRCPCCRTLLGHVFDCLGSTLFIDDDPHTLLSAFKPTECDQFSEKVLAALIVLNGRPRTRPQYA
jgi:hypothetical protein